MLCNFLQERNTTCFYLFDINVLHNIKEHLSSYFVTEFYSQKKDAEEDKIGWEEQ
jgi:hypothetical protein